jgi:hypothetical protein
LLLIVLFGNAGSALAGFAPSFYLDGCAWEASHVVVVSEGDKIDGIVEVLESWKGDLEKGERITVPELAVFANKKKRVVSRRLFDDINNSGIPDPVTCSRMILFLVKKQEKARPGVVAKVTWLPTHPMWNRIDASTVWVEKGQVYAFAQEINPGPSKLIPWGMNEREFSRQVTDILKARSAVDRALSLRQPDKLAAAILPMIRSGREFIRGETVKALGNGGPNVLPAIRQVLEDNKLAHYYEDAINSLAKAGGAAVGPELTRILQAELAFWRAKGPKLERGWWNGGGEIPWGKVEVLRDRYCTTLAVIRSLGAVRYAGCKNSVKAFGDYWRSLPQLHEVIPMSETCDAVIEKLR